ncbi:MAG: hypothetical protein QME81_00020 [bacterium]|nr:hypothetical protein [bacterium]
MDETMIKAFTSKARRRFILTNTASSRYNSEGRITTQVDRLKVEGF